MKKVELLAPAGDLEKLIFAVDYGADAVFIGGEFLGLRTSTKNFTLEEIKYGLDYAHERGARVFLTLNAIPHNEDIGLLYEYLNEIRDLAIDAFIVSDPGVFAALQEVLPEAEIHISTQANNTNYKSANFWHKLGASRVILARELSLEEIREMQEKIDEDLEIEVFVHGAMCMSYSGRCLLSNFMANRDANRGACAQPCRWKYKIVEEQRPENEYEIEQDQDGSYIFNSKDLCAIGLLKELIESGVSSLKIEGRSKSIYYVSEVVRIYREAIDAYYADPERFTVKEEWIEELKSVSHREYTSGFLLGKPNEDSHLYGTNSYVKNYDFLGVVLESEQREDGSYLITVQQRNKICLGDEIEVIGPQYFSHKFVLNELYNDKGEAIPNAPHPKQIIQIVSDRAYGKHYMLRKRL
ncbi:MAG: U32 family peptidase [Bacillota bacterium]|nr:U32 family peptidase [Bacillota bacterium]